MIANYVVMFGSKSTEYSVPMIAKDHPEFDITPELDENGINNTSPL
jgi:hypothetical protein